MERLNARDLYTALWSAADQMRTKMTADVYKDYLLGLVFFKSLSDRYLYHAVDLLENRRPDSLAEAQEIYKKAEGGEDWEDLKGELEQDFGCFIAPDRTFNAHCANIAGSLFRLDDLKQSFRDIETSQGNFYEGLFADFDINSNDLGKEPMERNVMVASVIKAIADIDFTRYGDDALGDAYEYLIEKFAAESGKKAGEFYTPQSISRLISKIVTWTREEKEGFTVYDPCCGSGSLLLQSRNFLKNSRHIQYFGQENNNQTYNLARMNMMLHRVLSQYQHLHNGDTLSADWPTDEPTNFDAVVMNPPYSQKWNSKEGFITDPRFSHYEKLAPKSAADYAFLLHGFYHLKTDGTMGIVLPHGVLFRGNAEGVIRKHLIEDGSIYAVIGLPANIFYSTGIPTCIVVLKKDNQKRDILFIDASRDFEKDRARNLLTDAAIDRIFNAYKERRDIEKYSHLASFEEIKENDYNLNIPRYVDTFEEEEPVALEDCFREFREAQKEEERLDKELNGYFKELGLDLRLGNE